MLNLEKQFNKIPQNQLVTKEHNKNENDGDNSYVNRYANQILYSPSLKKLSQKKDASVMLKEEIGESTLRLKAAKFGHPICEIVPQYENTFYLPQKDKFRVPKSMNVKNRLSSGHKFKDTLNSSVNEGALSNRERRSIFTPDTSQQFLTVSSRERLNNDKMVLSSHDSFFLTEH